MYKAFDPITDLKTCSDCKIAQPLTSFHRDKSRPDGYTRLCKSCRAHYDHTPERLEAKRQASQDNKEWHRQWRAQNRERVRSYSARRNNSPEQREWKREYAKRNREKINAKSLVHYHIRVGHIPHWNTLPCVDCGAPAGLYHHEDYSRPLDVVPLCHVCHKVRHAKTT